MNQLSSQILSRLTSAGEFLSGEELSGAFGITRSAVWKHIRLLRSEGYHVDAVTGRGYRLTGLTGRAVAAEVEPLLTTRRHGRNLIYLGVTDSTNLQAKALAAGDSPEGTVVVADTQTGGRGRMGRTWVSPPGENLYFSLILRPRVPSVRVPQLTLLVAAAIHRALSAIAGDLQAKIKWPNDILLNDKKLCGVLCEMQSEPDYTHFVVVGIGINVNQSELPAELLGIATSLFLETGRLFSRAEILAAILNHFEPLYETWMSEEDLTFILPYLEEHALLQSRMVSIEQFNRTINGRVSGIARGGELIIESDDGRTTMVSSGEAHLRKDI
jgi:BirA family biotin operon repressor/biotin-[acetyl-CoA-carboxylase] ligase